MVEGAAEDRSVESSRRVKMPIHLVGSSRSGTSMLARLFRHHPDVAYLGEPRPIWMYGNAYRPDHVLTAACLTPRIARHIDDRFGRFLEQSGRSRFAEKTPSNCLRLGFIHALYPDCRVVNIIRDGRIAVRSQLQSMKSDAPKRHLRERLRQTNVLEWPAYLPSFFRTVWRTRVLRRPASYWGPKPPGWRDWLDLPPHLVAAKQWRALVEASIRDGRALPRENYLEIRYDMLVRNVTKVLEQVFDFCELEHREEAFEFAASHVDPDRQDRWEGVLGDREQEEIEAEIRPLLDELGYA